ncbi:FUSC family protein [Shewanella sp. SM34]|uniref:FUSC family protein n=1 Tax=unclassified Shewanella TaxID=196818 RepID=UPI0021DA2FD8|nr:MULTISPECIES: FUSC family protein [unclassified Shewanella]MCU8055794.1 FUSC family protein [Shewanella sp. SM35]MCU8064586.1 FUSC family protein [Shewanella sp. SM34]
MSVFAPATPFADFIYRHFRSIHALKLGLALLVAVTINAIWAPPHFIWSMVTIVIIMMSLPQVGGAIEKSLQRAIGTCLGSAYGVMLVATVDSYWLIMSLLILAVSLICFISAGRYSYAYLVAGFTIIIVGDANHDTSEALWRTANILSGCVIAILVSLFIFPIKAKQDWRSQLTHAIDNMAEVLAEHLKAPANHELDFRARLEAAMKAVLTQKKLFFSLEWESQTLKKHKVLLSQLANKQVRLITLLELLPLTRWQEEDKDAYLQINAVASELAFYLQQLAEFVAGKAQQLPTLPECLDQELQHRLQLALVAATQASTADPVTAVNDQVPQGFALTGYSWLIYQLAIAVEALYKDIAIIDIAYHKRPASQITPNKTA